MNAKPLSLTISAIIAAAALAGCSSNSDSSSSNSSSGSSTSSSSSSSSSGTSKVTVENPTEASGLLCIDENNNGKCDSWEASQANTYAGEIPSAFKSDSSSALLEVDDGSLFIAAPSLDTVSAYSTLLSNEILFNPTVAADPATAATYLKDKLGIDGALSKEQAEKLQASIIAALAIDAAALPYKSIAALSDSIIASTEFSATVNADAIQSQNAVRRSYQFSGGNTEWEQSDGDETPDTVAILKGRNLAVMSTHYHNTLVVIDTSGAEPVVASHEAFASVDGERYAIDAVTGASEHRMRSVAPASDGKHVYVNVRPNNDDELGNDSNTTWGLFKVAINDDGTFASHDDASTLRYANRYLTKVDVIGDKIYAEDSDADATIILNASDFSPSGYLVLPSSIDPTNIENTFFDSSGEFVYVTTAAIKAIEAAAAIPADNTTTPPTAAVPAVEAVAAASAMLYKVSLSASEVVGMIVISQEFSNLKFFSDNKKALAYDEEYAEIFDLESMTITHTLPLTSTIRYAAVTDDGHYAMFATTSDQVLTYDLNAWDLRAEAVMNIGERIRTFAVDDAGNGYAAGRGFVFVNKPVQGDVLTPEQIVAFDKEQITEALLNRGVPLSTVVMDLTLPDEVVNGAGSSLDWTSTLSSINLTPATADDAPAIGAITRSNADESGTLTASFNYGFRDIAIADSKEFNVNIRKNPASLPEPKTVSTGDNSSQYMAVNVDGDIMVAPVQFEDANEDSVYGFISVKLTAGVPAIVSGTAELPKTYLATESLVGVGIHGGFAIGVSTAVGETGQARIFNTVLDSTGSLADAVTTSVNITTGTPLKVGFNLDQSLAAVMILKEDESHIIEVYSLGDAGEITLQNTIIMAVAGYASYGPAAINDDASRVYQRDEDNVIMTDSSGATVSAAVHEIARVWFYNGRVFVNDYEGKITSFNETLDEASRQIFDTGTFGRMYGAAGREVNGHHYLYIPLQQAADANDDRESNLNGIYQFEIMDDGSLQEVGFSKKEQGADRMAVSGDGDTIFFSYRDRSGDDAGRWFGVVEIAE